MEDYTYYASEQELSEEDKKLLSLIYQRVQDWGNDLQPYYDRVKCARKVFLLDDPEQDSEKENGGNKPRNKTIQLQTLKSTINNCVADQMDNMPEALLSPERPGLENVATDLTDVVRFIMNRNHYEDIHRLRTEDFFVAGTSVTQITWDETMDYGHGDVAILRWPVEGMIWDPYVNDIQEGRALMKCSWHPKSWFAEHYPDKVQYIGSDDIHKNIGLPDVQEELSNDDEKAMLGQISSYLKQIQSETRCRFEVFYYSSSEDLLAHMNRKTDIVLLDISMGRMSGMDCARKLREEGFSNDIIFITSMEDYAIEGYSVQAFGFITKPVVYTELKTVIENCLAKQAKDNKPVIAVETSAGTEILIIEEILYAEVFQHDTSFTMADGRVIKSPVQLSEIEAKLASDGFYRCHRSYLVNMRQIKRIKGVELFVSDTLVVPLSKHRIKDFLAEYTKFMGVLF